MKLHVEAVDNAHDLFPEQVNIMKNKIFQNIATKSKQSISFDWLFASFSWTFRYIAHDLLVRRKILKISIDKIQIL